MTKSGLLTIGTLLGLSAQAQLAGNEFLKRRLFGRLKRRR